MWRIVNSPILLVVTMACASAGQLGPAAAEAQEESPESSPRSTDDLEEVRSTGTDPQEEIEVGDTVVVISQEAEVTDGRTMIARLSKGVVFRVLQVTGDSVFGWIHIEGALDIVWIKRGHEAGWVRRDQVRLATPADLKEKRRPAIDKPAAAGKRANSHDETGADDVHRNDSERRKRFTPGDTDAAGTDRPDRIEKPMPAAPRVADDADRAARGPDGKTLPKKPPAAERPDGIGAPGRAAGTGYAGHFSCRTFAGRNRQLCAAVSELDSAEVKRLLAEGADINARSEGPPATGMTILQLAVWYEWDIQSIRLLLEARADVDAKDERGNTALIYATARRPTIDPAVVRILIDAGADVHCRGARGLTALMHASMHGKPETLRMLIDAGAEINARDKTGWTALMHATRRAYGYPQGIDLLIAAGADVNATHDFSGTALSSAAYNGHAEAVERLIGAGAKVNSADTGGWTPLLCAATNGHWQIVKSLIESGADVNARDRLGRSPLSASTNRAHTEVAELLVKAGAR